MIYNEIIENGKYKNIFIYPNIYHYLVSSFFSVEYGSMWYHFLSSRKPFFSIYLRASLLVIKSIYKMTPTSLLKDTFPRYRNSGLIISIFFFFQFLITSENWVLNWIMFPYAQSVFSSCFQDCILIFGFQKFSYYIPRFELLCAYSTWCFF